MELLLIIWVLSPFIAIGLFLFYNAKVNSLKRENQRMRNHLDQLYHQGRISQEEYWDATNTIRNYGYGGGHGQMSGQTPGMYHQGQPVYHPQTQTYQPQPGSRQPHNTQQGGQPFYGPNQDSQPHRQSGSPDIPLSPQPEQPEPAGGTGGLDKHTAFEMEMESAKRRQPSSFTAVPPDQMEPSKQDQPVGEKTADAREYKAEKVTAPPAGNWAAKPSQPAGQTSYPGQPGYVQPIPRKTRKAPSYKSTVKLNPANVILLLGVLFITVAGLIFATTQWQFLPNPIRIISVFSQSLLFFIVSVMAKKRFQLNNTSLAFYALGSVFLPIGVLAVGYFQLFGGWLSLSGPGRYALGLAGSLLFMAASVLGAYWYKLRQFVWTALSCAGLAMAFLAMSVYPAADVMALVMALYFCGFSFGVKLAREKYHPASSEIWHENGEKDVSASVEKETKEAKAAGRESRLKLWLGELERFAMLQLCAGSIWILYLADSGILGFCAALLCGAAYLGGEWSYPSKRQGMTSGNAGQNHVGIYPFTFFLLASFFFLNGKLEGVFLALLEGACALVMLEHTKIFDKTMKTALPVLQGAVMAMALLAGVITWPDWTPALIAAVAVLTVGVTFTVLRGQKEGQKVKLLLNAQPLLLMVTVYGIYDYYLYFHRSGELFLASAAAAAFLLYRFFPWKEGRGLRTALSDVVFFSSCLLACFALYESGPVLLATVLACGILAVCAWDYRLAAFLLPFAMALAVEPAADFSPASFSGYAWDMLFYLVIVAVAATLAALRKHPYAQRLQQPFGLAVVVYWFWYTHIGSSGWLWGQNSFASAFSWLFTAYWIYCLLVKDYTKEMKCFAAKAHAKEASGSLPGVLPFDKAAVTELHRWKETACCFAGLGLMSSGWYTVRDVLPQWGFSWYALGAACAALLILLTGQWRKLEPLLKAWCVGISAVGLQISILLVLTGFLESVLTHAVVCAGLGLMTCVAACVPLHRKNWTAAQFVPVIASMYFLWYLLAETVFDSLLADPLTGTLGRIVDGRTLLSVLIFLLYSIGGRLLYKKVVVWKTRSLVHVNWLTLLSVLPVVGLMEQGPGFWPLILLSVYALLLYKREWMWPEADGAALIAAGVGLLASGWFAVHDWLPDLGPGWNGLGAAAVCLVVLLLGQRPKFEADALLNKWLTVFSVAGLQVSILLTLFGFLVDHTAQALLCAGLAFVLCLAVYALVHRKRWTAAGLVPVAASMYFLWHLLMETVFSSWLANPLPGSLGKIVDGTTLLAAVIFVTYGAGGRLMYKKVFAPGKGLACHIDWLSLLSVIPVLALLAAGLGFWPLLLFSGYALLFYKRELPWLHGDALALTAACTALAGAVLAETYHIPQEYRTLTRLIPVLAVILVSHFRIWQQRKRTEPLLFGFTVLSILVIMSEAMIFRYPLHAFVLGIGGLALLFAGWKWKRRSWFALAVVTLVIVGIYISRRFWLSLAWWIYLLAAGVILISAGAAHEKNKQKGSTLKGRLGEFWEDWDW